MFVFKYFILCGCDNIYIEGYREIIEWVVCNFFNGNKLKLLFFCWNDLLFGRNFKYILLFIFVVFNSFLYVVISFVIVELILY